MSISPLPPVGLMANSRAEDTPAAARICRLSCPRTRPPNLASAARAVPSLRLRHAPPRSIRFHPMPPSVPDRDEYLSRSLTKASCARCDGDGADTSMLSARDVAERDGYRNWRGGRSGKRTM
ncbi:hypothetical protein B0H10DRAFT_996822 [Mycena sp. CBHHK59/15]|nr:hypothetical protein B0H10DRAFT_996822 [Mycena sp. CBHHK59/15]